MSGKHAMLAPSGASRWMECTPSAKLESNYPDQAGEAAKEGTLAHRLGELLIKNDQKLVTPRYYAAELKKIKADKLYKNEMFAYCEDYATHVLEVFAAAKAHTADAILLLEQQINLTQFIPEGFGTGDAIVIADGVLHINDLKYGKGVSVDAVENEQMMIYGLGALVAFDFLYGIHTVRMTIYQPRIQNISTGDIAVDDLKKWAETQLKPKATLAFKGEGEFNPGIHCQFCRARSECKANATYNLEIDKYEQKESVLLKDEEVADILSRATAFEKWLKSIKEDALKKAVAGKKWPGFKLVEGRSNRVFSDEGEVEKKLLDAGFTEEIIFKPKKLYGITALQGELGKKIFDATLEGLIIKPMGKPTLVVETDKRLELNTAELVGKQFADEFEYEEE